MNSIIAAQDRSGLIGNGDTIPWMGQLPADMRHFRELTIGKTVVMGRKTFESIGGPLPKRRNIVVTQDPDFSAEGTEKMSLSGVEKLLSSSDEIFIIGGRQIYIATMPMVDLLELTVIEATFDGDVHFPDISEDDWRLRSREIHEADENNLYDFAFLTFERKRHGGE